MTGITEVPPAVSAAPERRSASGGRQFLWRLLTAGEIGVIAPLVAAVIIFAALNSAFLSRNNIVAMLIGMSFIGIIAVGQTMLLITGEFDLSVGSNAGLSAVVAAWAMTHAHLPTGVGIVIGILVGGTVGWSTRSWSSASRFRPSSRPSACSTSRRASHTWSSKGYPIYPLPSFIGQVGRARVFELSTASCC